MHRISKAIAAVVLAACAAPAIAVGVSDDRSNDPVMMDVAGTTATVQDFYALLGQNAQPDSLRLLLLADYLRKLHEAERLGMVPDTRGMTAGERRIAQGSAVFDLVRLKTADKAAADSSGAEAFFRANRADYQWSRPKFFGSIVLAESDDLAREAADSLRRGIANPMDAEAVRKIARRTWGSAVKVVTVAVEQGRNPFVDYAVFAGAPPVPEGRWNRSACIAGEVVTSPRCAADAGEELRAAYTAELARVWTDSLRAALPATVLMMPQ